MRLALYASLVLGLVLAIASAVTAGDGSRPRRSITPTETELEAVDSLQRRALETTRELEQLRRREGELVDALERIKARARSISEEARAGHTLAPDETLAWNDKTLRWDVYEVPVPVMPASSATVTSSEHGSIATVTSSELPAGR